MLRAALYARFSTDLQSDASVEDQMRLCERFAANYPAEVVERFHDMATSGSAIGNRPGYQALLRFAKARQCDVVIAEHTDRLTRDGGSTWDIFKDLRALGIKIVTVNQGEIGIIHAGMSGTMSELMIEETSRKTRRGLEGVVLSGRSAGGMAYGYRSPLAYDVHGERIRGLREIDEAEAEVVRRIFREFAAGASPLALADALNREGVPGPRASHWLASTIAGSAQRGVGILRNELYRGVRVWGRSGTVKDRLTGRRRTIPGTGSVQRVPAPELRIVDDDLWARAHARLHATSAAVAGPGQRRPLYLLSGLIRCGACGGAMTSAGSGGYLRCSGRSNRGGSSCSNTRNPSYPRIEGVVLQGIRANLLHPVAIDEAMKAFRHTLATERKSLAQQRGPLESQLADVQRRAERLVREVEQGMPWAAVKDRHAELLGQQAALEAQLRAAPVSEVVTLHTGSVGVYRALVDGLGGELDGTHAMEARDAVRGLISEVRFLPLARKGAFELDVHADLAPLFAERTGTGTHGSVGHTVMLHPVPRVPVQFRLAG